MSKYLAILLAACCMLTIARAATSDPTACSLRNWCDGFDGAWWQRLPAAAKLPVVQGMISSYEAAYGLALFNGYSAMLDASQSGTASKDALAMLRAERSVKEPAFSKSMTAYVASIDAFYKKYPGKIRLNVTGVLRCLQDNPEASCDKVGTSMLLPWPTGP
jgi:hypothetical protein